MEEANWDPDVYDQMLFNFRYYDSLISLNEFCAQDFHLQQTVTELFEFFEVFEAIFCNLSENNILQIHEWTGS